MRQFLSAIVVFTFVCLVNGQTPDNSVIVAVGKQSIKLPAPTGYINAWETYPHLRTAFEINETENNQMLAIFAPLSSVPSLDTGRYLGFPRYSKVSVSKRLADTDVPEAQFGTFVDMFEKGAKSVYKADGQITTQAVAEIKRDLKKYFGTDAAFELQESTYLGPIGRSKTSFVCAGIMVVEAAGKKIPVYNTTAVLLVKRRILFVYFYGNIEAEGDLEAFNAESQKLIDEIVAENRTVQRRPKKAK